MNGILPEKIKDSNKWVEQHLEDKQKQLDELKGSE